METKEGEIKEFKLIPYTVVRFGLGSTMAIKRWARFELRPTNDLYWTDAINVRKDVDKTNTHISLHKTGEIVLSRYINNSKVSSKSLGNIYTQAGQLMGIHRGRDLLEPGYLYYGLNTIKEQDKVPPALLIECLDNKLVNSRLDYSLDIFPSVGSEKLVEYAAKLELPFYVSDQRSHLYIFLWGEVTLAVSMRFTEGDQPIDIRMVHDADSHPRKLKRLFHEDSLKLL